MENRMIHIYLKRLGSFSVLTAASIAAEQWMKNLEYEPEQRNGLSLAVATTELDAILEKARQAGFNVWEQEEKEFI